MLWIGRLSQNLNIGVIVLAIQTKPSLFQLFNQIGYQSRKILGTESLDIAGNWSREQVPLRGQIFDAVIFGARWGTFKAREAVSLWESNIYFGRWLRRRNRHK